MLARLRYTKLKHGAEVARSVTLHPADWTVLHADEGK